MFIVPVVEFKTPEERTLPPPAAPPVIVVAVIVSVPDPELFTAGALIVPKHLICDATIDELAGDAAEKVTAVADVELKMDAVSVIPLFSANDPPAVAPPVVSFLTSPVAPRSVETLTVMTNELAMRTSPATNVTAAAVPLGVVAQTSVALMFPALRAK
jgi:hypothetical protein